MFSASGLSQRHWETGAGLAAWKRGWREEAAEEGGG